MADDARANNKRIAKNTLLLYMRMLLTMLVSLYTSRVTLNVLGVNDFGIFNVVGGIVTMFSFITGTMATASQRFLSFDLAKGDNVRMKQTFSLIMLSYLGLMAVTLLLSETIGVWFLNTQMNIPEDRMEAANWVLQCSIFSFCNGVFTAPYMAVIIARERMGVYAYASIGDVVFKLLIVYLLTVIPLDKLKVFAVLIFLVSLIMAAFYRYYCKRHFPESHYKYFFDKKRMIELCSFATWNVIGAIANVLRSQGLNILLNIFFNPAINAARGIAFQVNGAVTKFTNNFYTAVRPQLTKDYAANDMEALKRLGYNSTRYASFLMLILTIPIFAETREILTIWLKIVPDYSVIFVQITLVQSILECVASPLTFMLQASGKIKYLQLSVSIIYLLVIPVSYIFLSMGYPPTVVFYINALFVLINYIPRFIVCKVVLQISILEYFRKVMLNISIPVVILIIWVQVCRTYDMLPFHLLINICIHIFITLLVVAFIGAKSKERKMILKYVVKKIKHQ